MILQSLVKHYETLVAKDRIASPGWTKQKISWALEIDDHGNLLQIHSLSQEITKGKKTVWGPQEISVPSPVKRTVGVMANFLADHSGYILGVDNKGNPNRTAECFQACRELHESILRNTDSPAAKAVLAFFSVWNPIKATEDPVLSAVYSDVITGGNLIFHYHRTPVHEDPEIRRAWQNHYQAAGEGPEMTCLITGEKSVAETVHPSIKGVVGAQSSGAALVSFNAPAFCSYGKEQNLNAPTSKYAAFAYTSALNYMLSDTEHIIRIGDTTVLFWAEGAETAYQGIFMGLLGSGTQKYTEDMLCEKTKQLLDGECVAFDETYLDPKRTFYILGLSPNAARLSVRFFMKNTFGSFLKNVQNHHDRMQIARSSYDIFDTVPIWRMLQETVNMNSRDKTPSQNMSGAVLQAVLNDTRYPATLLNNLTLRIRADREMNRERAAILKAYYLQNTHEQVPKEVLTVSLNRETVYTPYCLGRLFAVYEKIQKDANPGLNSTIKDKYFNSASATPAVIFPTLDRLSKSHLKKLHRDNYPISVYLEKELSEITDKLDISYPLRMTLAEQGSFQLGYYHQNTAFYTKNQEDTKNV